MTPHHPSVTSNQFLKAETGLPKLNFLQTYTTAMGQTVSAQATKSGALCATCHSLLFDDKGNGGFAERSVKGDLQLFFNPSEAGRAFPVTGWYDTLPDLPVLERSTLGGCQICRFLKRAILDRGLHRQLSVGETTEIFISLFYEWGVRSPYQTTEPFTIPHFPEDNHHSGLCFLTMTLEASDRAFESIIFSVHSRDGT